MNKKILMMLGVACLPVVANEKAHLRWAFSLMGIGRR